MFLAPIAAVGDGFRVSDVWVILVFIHLFCKDFGFQFIVAGYDDFIIGFVICHSLVFNVVVLCHLVALIVFHLVGRIADGGAFGEEHYLFRARFVLSGFSCCTCIDGRVA